ncbi:M16 family metallopeptidase [Desulfobotulus mexicanus]|uniref:Insulinase family protein n=1 Tax=Desulfobotulus mexicanus TaxID=2586642 RepID=A0A5S5MFI5_9BACT|nr:M16 family metallopeptidase [Desulfobotulus mexicanus]TYT74395.1 insulinase family protein [Desulfobotulus mexicanus]
MSYQGIISRVRQSRIPAIAVTCLFLFAGNLFALPDTRGWIHEKSDLPLHPDLITGTLDNGLRYVILPHQTPRNRASLHLNVQAGSFHESDAQQGLAHFVEHMAFNGSTNFPPGTLIHYFQSIGMSFGGDTNAHTGLGETVYHILLPKADEQGLKKGFQVLADYAHGLIFDENEIEREKGVILAEKRARDSARYRTGQALRNFLLPGIRSNERPPIGKKAVIEKGDRKELLDYYNTWYRPEAMMVILVGDVDPYKAEDLIMKHFSPIIARAPEREIPDLGHFSHEGELFFHHAEPESGDVSIVIAASRMVPPRKDNLESRKESLTLQLGSMLLRHRLSDRLSDPATPYNRAVAMADIQHQSILSTRLVAIAPKDKWEASLSLMEQELRKALTHGFSEEEMDRVRRETLSYLDRRIAGFSTIPSRKIADEIIQAMNTPRVFTSPEDDKALFAGFIEEIQAEDVLEAMKNAWGDDHRLIAITGNTSLDDHTALSRMQSVWEKSTTIPVAAPDMAVAAIFPYLPEPAKAVQPLTSVSIEDLEFSTVQFANHTTLHVKQTDFEADTVRVLISFGPGRAHEPEDWPGLSLAAPALVNLSGTATLDRPDLARALAGKGMSVEFSVAQENFRFSASSKPEDFSELMNLLRHRLLDPAFRTEAWELVRRRAEQEERRMESDIAGTMQHIAPSFFASFDPRFSRPKASEMNEDMRRAAENWLKPAFMDAALEITVVGNVNPELVIGEVGRYFGDLPRSPRKEKTISPLAFNEGAKATYWVDTQIPSAQIRIGFPTMGLEPVEESRGLTLLSRVLSDRIRKEIREKQGLAYSPRSFHQASSVYKDYGGLYIQTGARPDQVAMVHKAIMDVSEKLKREGVSEEELRRARDPLLTGLKDRFRNNSFWLAGVMAGSVEDPRQLDRVRTLESGYLEITAKDLTRLAEKWLKPDRASSITVLPVGEEGL